jgi:hypothetical protein
MTDITISINDELIDDIVSQTLIDMHFMYIENLENQLKHDDSTMVFSGDFDEEVFRTVEKLLSIESVLSEFGNKPNKSVDIVLEDCDTEYYKHYNDIDELRKEKEKWVSKALTFEDSYNELKSKLNNLL